MAPTTSIYRRGARLLTRTARTHPGPFWTSVGGAAVFGAATVGTTVALGWVTDEVLVPAFDGGDARLTIGIVVIIAVAVVRALGVVMRRYFAGVTNARMQETLRRAVADAYVDAPLTYHRDHPTGDLLARADTDVHTAIEMVNPFPFAVGTLVLVVVATVSLLVVDPYLTAVGAVLFPALAALNRRYTAQVENPAAAAQALVGRVGAVAHESIDGALVVKTLGRERSEVDRLAAAAGDLRDQRIVVGDLRASYEPLIDALPSAGTVALVAVGAWRVNVGAVTYGELVQAMALFGVLWFPLRVIAYLLEELPRSVAAIDRVDEALGVVPEPAPAVPLDLPPGALAVAVRSVSGTYGADEVLDDVDLDVAPGTVTAIVGATGAGKSTLMSMMARLVAPTRGSIAIGGIDLARVAPASLTASVALVFQESFLFAETIRANLTLGRPVTPDTVEWAVHTAAADFAHELDLGLDTVVGERGVTLSGGQRQRLALARALVGRPGLLLLDDATSALDPTTEATVLQRLGTGLDATVVVVAHRRSTIALAHRVVHLDAGRVIGSGSHEELLASARYRALVEAYDRGRS